MCIFVSVAGVAAEVLLVHTQWHVHVAGLNCSFIPLFIKRCLQMLAFNSQFGTVGGIWIAMH